MKKTLLIFGCLFLALTLNNGCKKDKDKEPDPEAPVLPEKSSLIMDFSNFGGTSKEAFRYTETLDTSNYGVSAFTVGVWNLIITVGLAVPVGCFRESFNHAAKYLGDNVWEWTYTVPVNNINYTARLTGQLSGEEVNWIMYVSQAGGFQNFVWYTGNSKLDRTSGSWTLYESAIKPNTLLGIQWIGNQAASNYEIRYANIVPNGPENGGYIVYGLKNSATFDAYYNIYNKGKNNLTKIEWNRTGKNGHIKDPLFYHDTLWHCWDAGKLNVLCN